MNALLRQFVEPVEADLRAAGFVRRGPVFRYFDADGNGIAIAVQRTTALWGQVEFFVNVGVLIAPYLRHHLGNGDPRRDAMPYHGVWDHRLVATDDTAELPDHTFSLSTDADADRAATMVRTWLARNLPRMKSWLGNYDAMLATIESDREQSERASAEQLASGRWKAGAWPDGGWAESIIRAYAYADRGDVDALTAEIADRGDPDPDDWTADVLAIAARRRTEQQG
ncbi:DUF4304 domain-containing protein [Actinoplanes sp. KI2]|uniref:DUF4304 domain-containing protein n=1 Tax=Actinoplanes sp. KI2 TaxID=2983315 RepID=UPI0021D58FAA|nr:DUF4304 domain-containing protein [Actinoplanes sp. KI2]MCU7724288.1 DUF4304 domain-containing protein [Actinoplanes sp. KI2]